MDKVKIKEIIKDRTVLFVDDEKVVTEIMKNILPFLFKEAYYASNGEVGIELYKKNQPDLIITDISMPKLDGIRMMKSIKEINNNVPCIYLSGHNEQDRIAECTSLNCEYIIKPINSKVLFEAFAKLF